ARSRLLGHGRADTAQAFEAPAGYLPRPMVSRDGRWVLFTANWEKTLGTDPAGAPGERARQDGVPPASESRRRRPRAAPAAAVASPLDNPPHADTLRARADGLAASRPRPQCRVRLERERRSAAAHRGSRSRTVPPRIRSGTARRSGLARLPSGHLPHERLPR